MDAPQRDDISRPSDVLSYVILAGGLLTIAFSLYLVRTTYSSLPYWDGWRQIEVAANGASPVSPSWLWQQHNEHRLVLPKLFLAVDLQLFGARQAFMLASIFAIQLMHLGLLSWSMRALGNWNGVLWRTGTGLAAFCLFCPTQWENFVWGFQVSFILPAFFATASFVSLALYSAELQGGSGKNTSPRFLVVSMLCAFAAAYSLASGSLLWPVLVAAAVCLRLGRKAFLSLALAGAASTALYLYHYSRPVGHANPTASLKAPIKLLEYCWTYFSASWPYYLREQRFIWIGLLLLLAPALPYVLKFRMFAAELLMAMAYCLLTSFVTASARINFGVSQAMAPRYQTIALQFWCCLGLLWLGGAFSARPRIKHLFLAVQVVLLAIFAEAAASARNPLGAAVEHAVAQKAAAAALLTGVADPFSLSAAYPEQEMFAKAVPYMRARRLSVFSDPLAWELGKVMDSAFPRVGAAACSGALEAVVPVRTSYSGAGLGPGVRILGWAWDEKRNDLPSAIVVTINHGIAGVGTSGTWRPSRSDGFLAFAPELPAGASANVYAIVGGSTKAACQIGRFYAK
jgi:hypothetical protein